ncbi:hypothetical protein I302_108450 [Kwoniella bestiolae CBS 10118]|uniref:Mog1p/PsbP-like protein n=1 Tax=Kwoniella bestiolae CBS 10118 TaxID=1296100 RepID=A0A1B9FVQ5_9TREE|nr:hypothetical protein I302_07176 [Kwoniella bestiolae CBS 10118]OCF22831.1 hypothetical protein I302_07176 [Kwoniella bestiolae CBS 10118]
MTSTLSPRALFGGAISLNLPSDYLDASDLRQIPDNQEVFLSSTSDTAIVLEVLGMVEDGLASTDLWDAVKFHFSSISHDNASLHSTILTPAPSHPIASHPTPEGEASTPTPIVLGGTQRIHKFSHNPSGAPREGHEGDIPDEVWIGVALWRIWLEDQQTGKRKKADLVLSVNVNLSAEGGLGVQEKERVERWFFGDCVKSLRIEDFGLFGYTE